MDAPRVSVLMSTYNGEKYLAEQIDSILAQKGVEVQLLIRDDGSTDRTIEIVKEYAEKFPNVSAYTGENLGIGRSFMELLGNAPEADYYAFADQDDVWLEDKLSRAVEIIQKTERSDLAQNAAGGGIVIPASELQNANSEYGDETVPVLYASNQTLVDAELKVLYTRFSRSPECDFYRSLSRNVMYGCTMVLNRELKRISEMISLPSEKVLKNKNHDAWLLYCAYLTGIVIYDHESRILYRQHENNAVGGLPAMGIDRFRDKWHRFTNKKNRGIRSMLAGELLENFDGTISNDIKERLELLRDANSVRGAYRLCRDKELVHSFDESPIKIVIRGMMKWI